MTDWNLVSDSTLAIEWLAETDNVLNANKSIHELWLEKFQPKYNNAKLFNKGVLIMASYILFIYIKENEFNKFNYSKIFTNDFNIVAEDKPHNTSEKICRRIRNSIAHGSFEIVDTTITFKDHSSSGNDNFKAEINIVKFGKFISNFANEINNQLV